MDKKNKHKDIPLLDDEDELQEIKAIPMSVDYQTFFDNLFGY